MKQPQNSPLSVAEQIAIIYAGINGYLDDLEVSNVQAYCATLLSYIKVTKTSYVDALKSSDKFNEEVETLLKEAITESKAAFS